MTALKPSTLSWSCECDLVCEPSLLTSDPPTGRVEGGELFDRVVSVGKFSEPVAKLLFYQMLEAVKVALFHHVYPQSPTPHWHGVAPV